MPTTMMFLMASFLKEITMPTTRSVKLDSARSIAASEPTGTLLHFVPRKMIAVFTRPWLRCV